MNRPVTRRRSYSSPLREQRARANREAVLEAAQRLFLANGYPRTSVASIAAEAGVSEDLVYLLFRTKRDLLVEVLNFVVTGETDSPKVLDQSGPQQVRAETDQRRQIALFADDVAHRVQRALPIDDVMRSAALVDDDIAAKHRSLHETRLHNLTKFVRWVAANGPLRDGLSIDDAAATVWVLTGPDMHRLLVRERGWDIGRYATWLRGMLESALLPPG